MLTIKAYAKINLALDILRKRGDGYHEVSMIMQSVSLADILCFEKKATPGTAILISDPCEKITADSDNLIAKAADLFFTSHGIKSGITVTLEKNIPIAAGLAGGSADAAATLLACNRLFDSPYSLGELLELGARLGADIPFCMTGGLALATGFGEQLEPLPPLPEFHICIAVPDMPVSTAYIYNLYDDISMTQDIIRPSIGEIVKHVKNNAPIADILPFMYNALEPVTVQICPAIPVIEAIMGKNGTAKAQMSGSGPAVFGIFNHKKDAERAADAIVQADHTVKTAVCTNLHKGIENEMD